MLKRGKFVYIKMNIRSWAWMPESAGAGYEILEEETMQTAGRIGSTSHSCF